MSAPVQVSCPACRTVLRVAAEQVGKRVRCPKCKDIFAAAAPAPPFEVVPEPATSDDRDFYQRLADASDPLAKPVPVGAEAAPKIAGRGTPPRPAADDGDPLPLAEEATPRSRKTHPRRREPAADAPPRRVGNGLVVALVVGGGLFVLCAAAGAAYVAYTYLADDKPTGTAETAKEEPKPKAEPKPTDGKLSDAALARTKAATVGVKALYADGETTAGSGFFVPGPGLVVTADRAVGRGRKPAATRLQVTVGAGTADVRTLGARLLGADAELGLALLQVTALDLPEPLPLGDSFQVKETHKVFVFAVIPGERGAAVVEAAVTGQTPGSGPRPWFRLAGTLPRGAAGGPVTDAGGKVIGAGGAETADGSALSAVPAETVQSFVRGMVKSAEAGGPVAAAPPGSTDSPAVPPGKGDDDPQPAPGFQAAPGFPPGFPQPFGKMPRRDPQPAFPQPAFPQPGFPPFNPPAFPQPFGPPGFPPDPKPPGPPKAKMTFPVPAPAGLKSAPLAADSAATRSATGPARPG